MRHAHLLLSATAVALAACADRTPVAPARPEPPSLDAASALGDNPSAESWGPIANPDLQPLLRAPRTAPTQPAAVTAMDLFPVAFTATLKPGETAVEYKKVTLPATPPRADVVFSLDLTGSMGGELANMKANSVGIMTAVAAAIGDVHFGVLSYEDYAGRFTTSVAGGQACNYSANYGAATDQPYRLSQAITGTQSSVATAINALSLGAGSDGPESYSRMLYESYAELIGQTNPTFGAIGWRAGARKIVVNFGDNVPHDCDYDAIIGGGSDSGHDPGRDNVVGTADDLHIQPVLAAMAANNVTLINLNSGGAGINPLWNAYAAATGGTNFQINADGTFPGGVDPASAITSLILSTVRTVGTLTLAPCPGSEPFASWIVGLAPASHTNVALPSSQPFTVTYSPPAGTPSGVYSFALCAFGDGAEFGRQRVTITVVNTIPVVIDIKPGSWPNSMNLDDRGRTAVAILTTPTFDAATVLVSSLVLGDELGTDTPVAKRNNGSYFASLEDVDGDGDLDLVVHFEVAALVANGDLTAATTSLVLRGTTTGGQPIAGTDAVRITPSSLP